MIRRTLKSQIIAGDNLEISSYDGVVRYLAVLLILIALGYLALVAFVYLVQDRLLYFPDATPLSECAWGKEHGFKVVEEKVGERVVRGLVRESPSARAWLVMFHGNGSSACHSLYLTHRKSLSVK